MMDVLPFSLQILYCATIGLNVLWSTHGMELTGTNTYIFENMDFTLRCSNSGNALGSIKWTKTNPDQTASMGAEQSICKPYGFLQDSLLYTYDCSDDTAYLLTLKNISRGINGQIWNCGKSGFPISNAVTISVYVPVTSLTLSPNSLVLTGSENSTISLTCTTSECKPKPRFIWYKNDSVMTEKDGILSSNTVAGGNTDSEIQSYTNTITLKLSKELNEWYLLCDADNQNGNPVSSRKIRLNVTYPPVHPPSISSISKTDEMKVFQNDRVHLGCSVTGGNPLPSLEWNKNGYSPMIISGNTVSNDISLIATELTPVELICRSIHPDGNKTAYITINILYPPDKPQVMIRTSSDVYLEVNGKFSVIENKPFTLNCSAKSNPPVSMFKWNGLSPTNVSFLYNMSVDRHLSKPITCEVFNVMKTSDSRPIQTGTNITQVVVNVLYPPKISALGEGTVIEGDNIDYSCTFTQGNPDVTNISWSYFGNQLDGQRLQIKNISRSQTGFYSCTVKNIMVSSEEGPVFGNDSGVFKLTVQYKSKVLKLLVNESEASNVTVNENDAVNISCEIEGNPLPTGDLLHQRTSFVLNQQPDVQTRNSTFRTSTNLNLSHSFLAQCTDTGVQTCRGISLLHNGQKSESSKSISLFVKCKPRISPFFKITDTVRSPTKVEVTLSFSALAYPVPTDYVWDKKIKEEDDWLKVTDNATNTLFSTWGLQFNLTIKDVKQEDYGQYRLSIKHDLGDFNYIFRLIPAVYPEEDTSNPTSNASVVAAAIAGAIGGFAIMVAVIIVAIFYKRRFRNKKPDISSRLLDLNTPKELNHGDQQSAQSNDHEQSSALPLRQSINIDDHGLQELDDCDENCKNEYAVYGNTPDKIKRIERVDVVELFPYLTDKSVEFFGADYAKLPQGLTKPYEFSQKPENIALNRYHGIYPYDHSRVKIPSIPDYFINASYIDGYKRKKAYIASLGPLIRTSKKFVMFWQMVWSEKSDVIVMLTKLTEPSGVKCDQYWPKDGTSVAYGDVTVTSTGEEVFSDYVMRKFSVSKGGQKRKLTHFHFMAWPDKSIPEDVTCLLEFRRSVRANHSSGPLIVHCSAGIGRTGTLIAIDILIEEGQKKGSVNVLECVKTMREQRTNMVQTLDQYFYIYKALVNALVFDNEAIPADKIHKYSETSKVNRFSDMFQKLNMSVESETTIESNSRMINKACKDRNRAGSDIPGDAHRVRLFLNRGMDASDYINATYLNSFTVADHFIVAQTPLLNGVEDFLCLIYQEKCSCVVSMDGDRTRQDVGLYLPPDNANFSIGSFNVHCSRLETKETYIVRKMKIECTGQLKGVEKVVYHFEFLGWSDGNKVPNDPQQFVEFTKDVERFESQFGTEGSHVLVHCLSAFERSCLFCAVVSLTEKIKHENEVCIPNTLRQIRTRRKLAIPTLEQFRFCYQAADAYVSMEKIGTNNAENSYMNVTLNS